jgi:catechol 2,3-dioxygenase-like lactoylglutathione lyase family enzyme
MKQGLSIVTLGVRDLEATRRFYEEKFGWQTEAANNDIVFFKLNGALLGLFPHQAMAAWAGRRVAPIDDTFRNLTLAYLTQTRAAVDDIFAELDRKGVTIIKRPTESFFGAYGGYVEDNEGNVWEFAFNPLIGVDSEGNVSSHRAIDQLEGKDPLAKG